MITAVLWADTMILVDTMIMTSLGTSVRVQGGEEGAEEAG
jgi:hypothetical protein